MSVDVFDAEESEGHGRIGNVASVVVGDELAVAALANDTVLVLDDSSPFDERPIDGLGWLTVDGGDPIGYLTRDDDADSVTLASPLAVAAGVGSRVELWTGPLPDGRPATVFEADLSIDDQDGGDPPAAAIDHALVDKLPRGFRDLAGESVRWVLDDSNLRVVDLLARVPTTNSDYLDPPNASAAFRISKPWANDSWLPLKDLTDIQTTDFVFDAATGLFHAGRQGRYLLLVTLTFDTNGNGSRGARAVIWTDDGTGTMIADPQSAPNVLPRTANATTLKSTDIVWLNAGQAVSFEGYQNSTGSLQLNGQDGDPLKRPTEVAIARLAA